MPSPIRPVLRLTLSISAVPLVAIVACLSSCSHGESAAPAATSASLSLPSPEEFGEAHPRFDEYWYQGVAELTRYRLEQARYGEVHEGEAVLLFVTEDFLPGPQVKHELGPRPADAVSVLKLNAHRQFFTGIYPYTTLTSVFSPVDGSAAFKVAGSVVEWCGVTYTQLNRRPEGIVARLHSYFESEADQAVQLEHATFEDGLWAALRRGPAGIQEGRVRMVPAAHYLRFAHRDMAAYDAEVRMERGSEGRRTMVVTYPDLGRELRVEVGEAFPHIIYGWEERERGGPPTRATRTHAILTDYWAHNGLADGSYRAALGMGADPPRE